MAELPLAAHIDITRQASLLGHVWRATRVLYFAALAVFVPLYYVSVAASDFYATPSSLVAQPILVAAFILAWLATGSIPRGSSIAVCLFVGAFAAIGVEVVARIVADPTGIVSWHESFRRHDESLAPALEVLGPSGAVVLFLLLYGVVAAVLLAGAFACILLRVLKVTGMQLRLPAVLSASRRWAGAAGDAPSMLLQLRGGRRLGLLMAACAALVLWLPLLLPGQEGRMPLPAWSMETALPTIVSYLVVVVSDRAHAWPFALVAALVLWRHARRFLSPDARYVLSLDRRPPVLLLRSFADDRSRVPSSHLGERLLWRRRRLEEAAARAIVGLGPFIAVGDPATRLPELGAFRAQLPDAGWQDVVRRWIGEARAIVLIAGTTPWVTWELEQIAAANALHRVLLVVPPGPPDEVHARWRHVAGHVGSEHIRAAMEAVDPVNALAVRFTPVGGLVVMAARNRRERDYGLAVLCGLHGILAEDATGAGRVVRGAAAQ